MTGFGYGGFDHRAIDGKKAVTTQPFTELNSKTGVQYSGAFYIPSLAGGATADLAFTVGAQHVLLKDIKTQFNSELISIQFFKSPTFTGGTSVTIYNLNDADAVAPTSTILSGVSTSAAGTAVSPREYSIGTVGQGNRQIATTSIGTGVERVLEPGATYLFRVINEDGANASVISSVATWFQGDISVNI